MGNTLPRLAVMRMSSFCFLFLLPLLLIFFARADSDLIQKTCQMTNYFDVCVESLSSDPSSQDADVPDLAAIIIRTTMVDVSAASSFISQLLMKKAATKDDPLLKQALQQCGKSYANANTALATSLQQLSSQSYDYASVHVGAAKVYPRTCHDTFKKNPKLVYPRELAAREEGVEHKCDVALSIISLLVVV